MKLADVGLNSLYTLDSYCLSRIASLIGKNEESEEYFHEYEEMKKRINDHLWNEEEGIYLNRHWNGDFSLRLSPTNFYPLLARIPSPEQAERMINEHLMNPEEFWGEFVLPSISRNDKAFKHNNYWRGRIWPPMNFLVAEGLKRYDFYEQSFMLTEKSLKLFKAEWDEKNHIHENYNSVNGQGDDVLNSEPVYNWGGLLPFLAVQELIDDDIDKGLRLGSNFIKEETKLRNCRIGNSIYDLEIGQSIMRVIKDGKDFIKTDRPVLIKSLKMRENIIEGEIISPQKFQIEWDNLEPGSIVRILYQNQSFENTADDQGYLKMSIGD